MRRWRSLCLLFFLASVSLSVAQPQPVADRGLVGTLASIERLPVVASALHIVAHPDDENGGLLAYLSRGTHARTVLLTATRGEGGQNLLGPERGQAMGLLRTGEALAAARYYGVEQYFTRAYDFGYSKTAEETLQKWGRERVLADMVRVIRQVRPDIIISRFAGTARDGHGHHQAIGLLTREAFRLAGHPNSFPEQLEEGLRPWQPKKLYQDEGAISDDSEGNFTLAIDLGQLNPVIGYSYQELGILGLNQHRCQGMAGRIASKGSRVAAFHLVDSVLPSATREASFFDGIDTSVTGIAKRLPEEISTAIGLADDLSEIQQHALAAAEKFDWESADPSLSEVLNGLRTLRRAIRKVESSRIDENAKSDILFYLQWKERDFTEAGHRLTAVEMEAIAEDSEVVPGQSFRITVNVYDRGDRHIDIGDLTLRAPAGWGVESVEVIPNSLNAKEHGTSEFSVQVANDAAYSQPYYYREKETDGFYQWRDAERLGLPYTPPLLQASLAYQVDGVSLEILEPVKVPHVDRARGVKYREVQVVPQISITFEPAVAVLSPDLIGGPREWLAVITSNVSGTLEGVASLTTPVEWQVEPTQVPFRFSRESEATVARFSVDIPKDIRETTTQITAVARVDDRKFAFGQQTVSYPHIQTRYLYHPSKCRIEVVDLEVAPELSLGYILGTQDEVPKALEQLGVELKLLEADDLAFGDLEAFDCIVAGVRAYADRADLRKHNRRLLEYVRNGGVYIVQYNKSYDWDPALYAPYPAKYIGNDRITVEESPVDILQPGHPLFNVPNKITEKDFAGWVQERGLYFWSEWDPRYVPLLSGHDPGEQPKKGGMLVAEYGEGLYVYTAYAWFRQLPAGVPGAYRLFANLISLPRTRATTAPFPD